MPLWLRPGLKVFWKKTRSPIWSWSRPGCAPLAYWANSPRLSGLPSCLARYQTKPEQSKPLGLEPPQTYGEPRNFRPAAARPSVGAPGGGVATTAGGFGGADGLGAGVAA